MRKGRARVLTGYRAWLWLTLLCAALYLPGIASLPAMDRDESRFMQASRQMAQTGDTVRIRFLDRARNKKPAGIHWMQAAAVKTFSTPESTALWPYRLPSVLGATIAVLFTFALGLLFLNRRGAFLAAALLASSFVLVFEAHTAKTDAALLGAIMAAQYALARIYLDGRDGIVTGWRIAILFWAALAVGIMIKGPVPVAVIFLTLIALLVTDRQARFWRGLRPLVGVPLLLLIAAPWYLAIVLADDTFLSQAGGKDFLGQADRRPGTAWRAAGRLYPAADRHFRPRLGLCLAGPALGLDLAARSGRALLPVLGIAVLAGAGADADQAAPLYPAGLSGARPARRAGGAGG